MLEDHLYWAIVYFRWMDDANFEAGPARFFDTLPRDVRDETRQKARANVARNLFGQGIGRHDPSEIADLGCRSLGALASLLGNKAFLMGPSIAAVDATAFAMLASATAPVFSTPLKDFAQARENLMVYQTRLMREFYPCHAARQAA